LTDEDYADDLALTSDTVANASYLLHFLEKASKTSDSTGCLM